MIGTGHLWIILGLLLIVLIVYGPGKLPEVGGAIGRGINEFRKTSSGLAKEIKEGTQAAHQTSTQPEETAAAEKEEHSTASTSRPADRP
jgi:sec-independent protein translocase protein TatA